MSQHGAFGPGNAELGKITQAVLINLLLLLSHCFFCGVWGISVLSSSSLERKNFILRVTGQFSGRISPVLLPGASSEVMKIHNQGVPAVKKNPFCSLILLNHPLRVLDKCRRS